MAKIMGILNITPDSFSDGGQYMTPQEALQQAQKMKSLGADIIDIGAESTRPGATPLSAADEINRLKDILPLLAANDLGPFSIDTYKAEVAAFALDFGVTIINDIHGLDVNQTMAALVKDKNVQWVIMDYRPYVAQETTLAAFSSAIAKCLEYGLTKEQLILDPGLGFNKTDEDNLLLTKAIPQFKNLGLPLLYGPSRKRFLQHYCQLPAGECDLATAAVCAIACSLGADIVRVHNVAAVSAAVKMGSLLANK